MTLKKFREITADLPGDYKMLFYGNIDSESVDEDIIYDSIEVNEYINKVSVDKLRKSITVESL